MANDINGNPDDVNENELTIIEQQRLDEARARDNPDEARTTRNGIANNANAAAEAAAIANAMADNVNDFLGDNSRNNPAANQDVPRTGRPKYTIVPKLWHEIYLSTSTSVAKI